MEKGAKNVDLIQKAWFIAGEVKEFKIQKYTFNSKIIDKIGHLKI